MNGVYQATKWGLEGMNEALALAQERAHLGIRATTVQVGHMDSQFGRVLSPRLQFWLRRSSVPNRPQRGHRHLRAKSDDKQAIDIAR